MKKLMLAAIIFTIALTACKKSKVEEPAPVAPSVLGLWKGTINSNARLVLYLKSNNTIDVYNSFDTAAASTDGRGSGTWNQPSADVVNVSYKFNQQIGVLYTGVLGVNSTFTNMNGKINALGILFGTVVLNK